MTEPAADGRYDFEVSAASPIGNPMGYVGDPAYLTGELALGWQIIQAASDGSVPQVTYSTDGGVTFTTVNIGSAGSPQAAINESGSINVSLAGAVGITLNVLAVGGTADATATPWIVALSITRNQTEGPAWDTPNPFDPIAYNAEAMDFNGAPSATLAQLRTRIINRLGMKPLVPEVSGMQLSALQTYLMQRIGFAAQAANPPPGMAAFLTSVINDAQQQLYRRYAQDGYTDAAPALLVNPTDALSLDNQAVKLLATALAKAHYGQSDATALFNQFETYLKELMARSPPNLTAIVNDFLTSAQAYLYRRYTALHTRRFFRWKVIPGQRFYSLKDNDENVLSGYHLDPEKSIEWVGIQDARNMWYPLEHGINPRMYTMIAKPWRPTHYDIRQAIELYPAPNTTYWLWVRGHFGLLSFVNDTDTTTLDSELVFLHALANAKAHFKQPDANNIEAQANTYLGELIAGTHQTHRYVPHTRHFPAVTPPRMVHWDYEVTP